MKNKTLGKGLSILLGEHEEFLKNITEKKGGNNNSTGENIIDIELIRPGKFQPRKHFSEESLQELAQSIKSKGLIQPVIVRKIEDYYEIIAGERRFRASKIAGLTKLHVVIINITDKEALEFALLENIQRENLSPIEEAEAYQQLVEKFAYTQEQLANELGKSRSHITNLLRLLNLPDKIKGYLDKGQLTVGHAKILVGNIHAEEIADNIIEKKLSVREVESLLKNPNKLKLSQQPANSNITTNKDDELITIQNSLAEHLGMKVNIENAQNGGKVTIHFNNLEQFDRLIQKITG
ncbi:ParB/RepB/Spo0J family partition protein [Rickettsiales endosymbiont of Stachyamoeba lipophora]|uniref:ParB/RepB/Spo0J family partition protein n=1 Tax=Rickettsiales endosymbiont of Stachyamoeba lipophora TaxID=2486578 RepID=UPI000F6475DF|nr:ParB/RepB/Spo0J family partition protein [Rickettsiales endosymbiont of Stachyamoeba lipophora]AZL15633.1 ParB/RepB/Spo0J family partition protein [Rickettsiales endosymbiont of Stachyamoeba lipophora]